MTRDETGATEPNDPTRAGSPLPVGDGARLSLNEVEQLCLKAARGAGMSWGLAEEAGFAAAWLASRGLDGPGALLASLRGASKLAWRKSGGLARDGFRASDGGSLCPVSLGAALCDHARLPETAMEETGLEIGPVGHPILLLPFLSDLAGLQAADLRMDWPGGKVWITEGGDLSGEVERLARETRTAVGLSRAGEAPKGRAVKGERGLVTSDTLRGLDGLALRSTVPASDVSRAGAGASVEDND